MFNELLKRFSWVSNHNSSSVRSTVKNSDESTMKIVITNNTQSTFCQNFETTIDENDVESSDTIKIPKTLPAKLLKQESSFYKNPTNKNTDSIKESSTNNTSPVLKNNGNKSLLSSGLFKLDSSYANNIKIATEDDDVVLDISQEDFKCENKIAKDRRFSSGQMKYLSIPEHRPSILEKPHDLEINSDIGRFENISELSLLKDKYEVHSEKNEKEEKEVNINEIASRVRKLPPIERRNLEASILKDLYLEENLGEEHYFLNIDWMAEYTLYLNNKSPGCLVDGKHHLMKSINNEVLLNENSQLLMNLIPNLHYVVVNKYIWEFVVTLYGGGPYIKHEENGKIFIGKRMAKKRLEEKKLENNKKTIKKKKKTLVFGLINKSNYCFLNACLQCLFTFDCLNEYFLSESYKQINHKTLKRHKFILTYTDALKIVKLSSISKKNAVNLSGIQKLIKKYFNPAEQQDIHEFLRVFLSEMQEELTLKPQKNENKLKSTIIEDLFGGETLTKIICRNCKQFVEISDKFMDLSLPIKKKKQCNIYDCLNRYFNEDGYVDCYKCEFCGKKSQALKSTRLVKLPRILVIHFKRFKIFPKKQKIYDSIDFPMEDLDLSMFSVPYVKGKTFNLKCFASHLGNSDYGHYMAYAERESHWFLFNDESVKPIEKSRVSKRDAYLLFYLLNEI